MKILDNYTDGLLRHVTTAYVVLRSDADHIKPPMSFAKACDEFKMACVNAWNEAGNRHLSIESYEDGGVTYIQMDAAFRAGHPVEFFGTRYQMWRCQLALVQ